MHGAAFGTSVQHFAYVHKSEARVESAAVLLLLDKDVDVEWASLPNETTTLLTCTMMLLSGPPSEISGPYTTKKCLSPSLS